VTSTINFALIIEEEDCTSVYVVLTVESKYYKYFIV